MLRLHDVRTGSATGLRTRRHHLVRLWVHGESAQGGSATLLRALLLADVITRVLELRGWQILTTLTLPDRPREQSAKLKADAEQLNIHPPAAFTTVPEAEAYLDGAPDLHIAAHPPHPDLEATAPWIRVATVQPAGARASEAEPLAARLALLSAHYQEPVALTGQTVSDARALIERWRERVATWATEPSRPLHRDTAQCCQDAAEDDLDTVRALAALRTLENDPAVPGGAKFETFVYLDRIVGLDLAREVGRPRP